jgi:protein TonB
VTLPRRLSGEPPGYTREAREARVEGLMILRCVITTSGRVERCQVLQRVPHMEAAVLDAVSRWRFAPAMLEGRPVAVRYNLKVRLQLAW